MKMYVMFLLFGSALAQMPYIMFNASFDNDVGEFFVDDESEILFGQNAGGNVQQILDGQIGKATQYDGNSYFQSAEKLPDGCLTNVAMCNSIEGGEGFTLTGWARPDVPSNGSDWRWLLHFGLGKNNEYGIKIGYYGGFWRFFVMGKDEGKELICYVHSRKDSNGNSQWLFFSVRKSKLIGAPIYGTLNGIPLHAEGDWEEGYGIDCDNETYVGAPSTATIPQLTIGAAYKNASAMEARMFAGALDDIRFYHGYLHPVQIKHIMKEGFAKGRK